MVSYTVEARAKVNLSLDVVGRRNDGYHELVTIMNEVPLADEVTIELGGGAFACTTNLDYIRGSTNIALKAARLFYSRSGIVADGVKIHIEKRIPVGAGMGGGSTDAAAVLRVLNSHHGEPLSPTELSSAAAALGADVPFCLAGGAALCEGVGELLTPLPALTRCCMVIVKPPASLSTADMFAWLDRRHAADNYRRRERPDTDGIVAALRNGDAGGVALRVFNAMESSAAARLPEVTGVHRELLRLGAAGACMTGSGSAVFGIFLDRRDADEASNVLRAARFGDVWLLDMA